MFLPPYELAFFTIPATPVPDSLRNARQSKQAYLSNQTVDEAAGGIASTCRMRAGSKSKLDAIAWGVVLEQGM